MVNDGFPGAEVMTLPSQEWGVKGPTVIQDRRETSLARREPKRQAPVYGHAIGVYAQVSDAMIRV